jgi:hypothetical protein
VRLCICAAALRAADRERLPRTPFIPAQAGIHDFVSRASEARPGTPTPDLRPWVPAFAGTNGGESLGKHVRAGLRWTVGTRFATGRSPCGAHPRRRFGRIAQLVEQLTLNQRVPGSSPGAPTNRINAAPSASCLTLAGSMRRKSSMLAGGRGGLLLPSGMSCKASSVKNAASGQFELGC